MSEQPPTLNYSTEERKPIQRWVIVYVISSLLALVFAVLGFLFD
jgi:hypothetical protein